MKFLLFLCGLTLLLVFALKALFPLPEQNFEANVSRLAPAWTGPIGMAIRPALEQHPGMDGIRPLPGGLGAFAARAIIAREAVSSIDAQYYIWQDDATGLMLLDELRMAVERGVRVRLLLDDNGIPGLDGLLAELNSMPNAEVRIFNPFTVRSPKLLSYFFDFNRLNRRMHNKSMTVDGLVTIVGGRNIGDIYFEFGAGTHYFDVDAIAIGPIVVAVATSFDEYWNSSSSYAADIILAPAGPPAIERAAAAARASATGKRYRQAVDENELAQRLEARDMKFEWGDATLYADDPSKSLGLASEEQAVVEKLFDLADEVDTSLDLVSAYFIPGQRGADVLETLAQRGVTIRVLTNSLDATDVVPVHAAYAKYRTGLVDSGVEVLELKAMREKRADRSLPEILAGSASGLHAKVFGFDRRRVFIGSYNLDPRSARLNTEMGLLIESPTIAATLSNALDQPTFAYRVESDGKGGIVWSETVNDGTVRKLTAEPNASLSKRAMATVIEWLPIEWML